MPPRSKSKTSAPKDNTKDDKAKKPATEPESIEEKDDAFSDANNAAADGQERSSSSNKPPKKDDILDTQEVDMNTNKKDIADEKTTVNYAKKNFMSDFVKQDTKASDKPTDEDAKKDTNDGLSADQIREKILKEEKENTNQFSREELQDFAEVFMDILDMGISTGLRIYAKDTSTTAYELPVDKKRKITRQLTNLFIKYQTKFSLEFMLIITLFICYAAPAQKAHKLRKAKAAGNDVKRTGGKPSK